MSLLYQYYNNWSYVYPLPLDGGSYVQSKDEWSWYMHKNILVIASTFDCRIPGVFFLVFCILIVPLFLILKQAA